MNTKFEKPGVFAKQYTLDTEFFFDKTKEFYYFIGLMAADGNVRKNKKSFSLSQSNESGKKLIKYILKLFNSDSRIYENKKHNHFGFTITNPNIVKILNEYNILPNKTITYELPTIPDKMLPYFIQGYIAGDGSIGVYDNGNGIKSIVISFVGTENFILKLNELLPTKGNIRKIKKCKNLFELRFYGKKALDFGHYIYEDICFDDYKIKIFNEFLNDRVNGIKYKKYYKTKPIVIEKLKQGITPIELSKQFNIPYKTVHTWKTRFL
jgi:hypothetical protein